MPASHPSAVHSGWLVIRPPGSKASSSKRYFLLLPDLVLYSFRSSADTSALTASPLPGCSVPTGVQLKGNSGCSEKDREKVVKLVQGGSRRVYYLAGTSSQEVERWAAVLGRAATRQMGAGGEADSTSTSSQEYKNE